MTEVIIVKENNSIKEAFLSGHTGYGVEGEDIVCAALSSIVQTALLGLIQHVGINVDYRIDEQNGELRLVVPGNLSPTDRIKTDAITETMLLGISDLYQGYSDFIKLEVR